MGSHKTDLSEECMWNVLLKLTLEVPSDMVLAVILMFLKKFVEINVLIYKMSIWWVCIFQKTLFHKKISNRAVGNRLPEKENEVSSWTIYRSISHVFYCAVTSQFNLFAHWTTDSSQIASE